MIAREFVHAQTARERLPYPIAVHAGANREGREHNPHVHRIISARQHDGLALPEA